MRWTKKQLRQELLKRIQKESEPIKIKKIQFNTSQEAFHRLLPGIIAEVKSKIKN